MKVTIRKLDRNPDEFIKMFKDIKGKSENRFIIDCDVSRVGTILKKVILLGVHALNDWKNEFLRIINIRIDNFTKHPHLYKQPPSRSVKSLKKKMEKLHRKYVFAPADKAANNVIII